MSAAADSLVGAIVARFDSTSPFGDTDQAKGLWVEEVPADIGQNLPFCVLAHKGEVPEFTTEGDYLEKGRFDFILHASPLNNAEAIATRIKAAFDLPGTNLANAALSIIGAYVIECVRTDYTIARANYDDPQGGKVWEIVISYETLVRKTL